MIATEEPILSRLDRLDTILRHLEESRGVHSRSSPDRSSYTSTHSSGGDGHDDTPKNCRDSHNRSIDDVIAETRIKGTLLDRLDHVEDQVIQLCAHLDSELEADNKRISDTETSPHKKKTGLKQLVKSCIKSKKKNNDN